MRTILAVVSIAFASLCFAPLAVLAAEDPTDPGDARKPSAAEQIRGEWVRYHDTPNGRYMTIKAHLADHTVVTTYDPNHKPVQSHRSEYRVDVSGDVPIFRYRNKVVLIGKNAGAKDERESAYLLRIDGDRFFEVHGMLPGDKGDPSLIVWERLKDNPIPKPKA
jgi:CHASE2 domain-containing sensor protein